MGRSYHTNQRQGTAAVLWALWLLVLPLRWLLGAAMAAAFHELCHVAAVVLMGGKIERFRLGGKGALIVSSGLSVPRQLICTLAGPLGALLLLPFARWLPVIALCAFFQSIYNLLPVWPLDGARAWRLLLSLTVSPQAARKIWFWTEKIVFFSMIIGALYAYFWLRWGIAPFLVAFGVILNKNTLQRELENSTMKGTIK